MPRSGSDIPVGSRFNADLIDLKEFLRMACLHSGDRLAIQSATWVPPVHKISKSVPASRRDANLPLEAAVQYGLLEKGTYRATDLARQLNGLSGQDLYDAFGRHILLKLGGLRVVEAIEQMQIDKATGLSNVSVTGDSLARYLNSQGFRVTEHNTAINSMRLWLAAAGIFPSGKTRSWEVNRQAKERLLGLTDEAIAILAGFSAEQRAFVDALCRIEPRDWYAAASVRNLAEAESGLRLGRSSLPDEILEPLRRTGLLEYRTEGTKSGKTSMLRTTPNFSAKILEPFVNRTIDTLDPALTAYYKTRPEDIYAGLESGDSFVKGQSLEAYAIHIMRLLGLRFISWRKRAIGTGSAEIDVLLTGLFGGIPTLWQVQCKNTPRSKVDLEDIAKEVGVASVTDATHLLLIANAAFTHDARSFAFRVMAKSPLTIFLLDKSDFELIKASPGEIGAILRDRSTEIIASRADASVWSF